MENLYLCPYCRGHLMVNNHIVFSAKTGSGNRGIIFLSPKLGNYHCFKHKSFELKAGDRLEILCPICHSNLTATNVNRNLAEIIMVDKNNNEYDIYFSEIVGEKCTYKIKDKHIESYGENSAAYVNFFGV